MHRQKDAFSNRTLIFLKSSPVFFYEKHGTASVSNKNVRFCLTGPNSLNIAGNSTTNLSRSVNHLLIIAPSFKH